MLYGTKGERIPIRHVSKRGGRVHEYKVEYEGVIPNLERRYKETESDFIREDIERYMAKRPCPACKGSRLKPEALSVTIAGRSIDEVTHYVGRVVARLLHGAGRAAAVPGRRGSCGAAKARFKDERDLTLTEREFDDRAADPEGDPRAARLPGRCRPGLPDPRSYGGHALRRRGAADSAGHADRLGLMGVLYILDEPSIGLHQRDNARLIKTLERLRDVGNTLLVVEHDEETIRAADYIIDIGPGAGEHGGEVVAEGTLDEIMAVSRVADRPVPERRSSPSRCPRRVGRATASRSRIEGARENNLKDVDVTIPLGTFVDDHGRLRLGQEHAGERGAVQGAGAALHRSRDRAGRHDRIRASSIWTR